MRAPVPGVDVPRILYGTAWKEDATEELVRRAIAAGFRGIDTANQRKHYHEAGVGAALATAFETLPRSDFFLQSKFTSRGGQDHRLPYDELAPVRLQVLQSFRRSLEHLHVSHLDSLVLHGPSRRDSLGPDDRDAWLAMEDIAGRREATWLGISNIVAPQLEELLGFARIRPAFVQNRCRAELRWDRAVRDLCQREGILYQGFSLLTANPHVVRSSFVERAAAQLGRTPAQVVLRFAQQRGMLVLAGPRDPTHMRHDLELDFDLSAAELDAIEAL